MRGIVAPVRMGLKTITVTYQAATETAQVVPVGLPAAQTGSPQVSWTVASGDLPTESANFQSRVYVGCIVVGGKNTAAAARTVNVLLNKNGALVTSSSVSVPAGQYWTAQIFPYNIAVGNVFTVYMWDTIANDCDWRYDAHQVQLTRPEVSLLYEILSPVGYASMVVQPVLAKGPHPVVNLIYNTRISQATDGTALQTALPNTAITVYGLVPPVGSGVHQLYNGDVANVAAWITATHATNCPYYYQNRQASVLSWRNWGRLAP